MEIELNSFRFYFFLVLKNRKLLMSWLGGLFIWFFHVDFLKINTCLFHTYFLHQVDNRYPAIFFSWWKIQCLNLLKVAKLFPTSFKI